MMRVAAALTREWGVRTFASLNPIMVDGTGMCGGCRVAVGGKVRFACVDGPEFDSHEVDFDELARRKRAYTEQERRALEFKAGSNPGENCFSSLTATANHRRPEEPTEGSKSPAAPPGSDPAAG